jgi:branched-chain amino acid transport system ATP-binding protein
MMGVPVLDVAELAIGYAGVPVVSGITLRMPAGASLLVMGHNGAGKSTLLRSLFGLQPILSGTGTVGGMDLRFASAPELYRQGFRFLGQGLRSFNDLSVAESRRVLQRLYGFSAAATGSVFTRHQSSKKMGHLSVGQRRLEAILLLSAGAPTVYFLDEPTAGLDTRHGAEITEWILRRREAGISFVVVEQRFRELLRVFDLAVVIRRGKVTYFGEGAALRDERQLAEVFL